MSVRRVRRVTGRDEPTSIRETMISIDATSISCIRGSGRPGSIHSSTDGEGRDTLDKLQSLLAPHPRLRAARPGMPDPGGRCVIYRMQRAQRGVDNGALNLAIAAGNALNVPVLAVFGLTAFYPGAPRRHYRFCTAKQFDSAAYFTRISGLRRRGPAD
jgi:hypothetical protein